MACSRYPIWLTTIWSSPRDVCVQQWRIYTFDPRRNKADLLCHRMGDTPFLCGSKGDLALLHAHVTPGRVLLCHGITTRLATDKATMTARLGSETRPRASIALSQPHSHRSHLCQVDPALHPACNKGGCAFAPTRKEYLASFYMAGTPFLADRM